MTIICFKPHTQPVEHAPVVKKQLIKAPKAPRLVFNPDGTVSSIEDHNAWDFDKPNRLGE